MTIEEVRASLEQLSPKEQEELATWLKQRAWARRLDQLAEAATKAGGTVDAETLEAEIQDRKGARE